MEARPIVEGFDVVEDESLGVAVAGQRMLVAAFGFEGGEEVRDRGVVVRIGSAAHAGGDPVGCRTAR